MRALTLAISAAVGVARPASAQPVEPPTPAPAPAPADPAAPIDVAALVESYLRQEVSALNAGRSQAERDEAAKRLIARQSPAGRQEILRALAARPIPATPAPSAPLAAARAIADDPLPSPQFIAPLALLLGADRAHSEAAAAALLAIHDPNADAALTRFVADPKPLNVGVTMSVLRVLGTSADKEIARILVDLVTNPRQRDDSPIPNAAADALVEMTSLPENGRDVAAWRQWWQVVQAKPPDAFRADLLDMRRRRLPGAGMNHLDPLLARMFQLIDERAKPDAIRQILESGDARSRLSGVRLVYQDFTLTGKMLDKTPEKLRDMIRDSSPDVRLEVARSLQGLNDRQSLQPLLAQLTAEPHAAVRVAIMAALVEFRDPRAVPELIALINNPALRVAVTAAESLAKLGVVIRADPALTAQVSRALVQTINNRAQQSPADELRAACVEALVPLRDPQRQPLFLNLLNPNQGWRTRVAAIQGLGEVGDRNTGNAVINWLRGEQDPRVRLAALGALRSVGTFQLDEAVFNYTKPQIEPDPDNRKAAWTTFVALMPDGSKQRLTVWAERFFRAGEFDRRIPVLQEILAKQEAGNEAEAAALTREQIGESYIKLQPAQPLAAIPHYRAALQYWLANNGAPQVLLGLTRSLLEAQLAARQYAEAVTFAGESIARDPRLMPDVMGTIATTAERLQQAGQNSNAERLATEALKLTTVEQRLRDRLQAVVQKAKQ